MKTQGEIEAAICDEMTCIEKEYMGRGPKQIHAHLIGDLILVRTVGALTSAEQQLATSLPAERGRDLLKQMRNQLFEASCPLLRAMIANIAGVGVRSFHHDISTVTGEEIVVLTLERAPAVRDVKKT